MKALELINTFTLMTKETEKLQSKVFVCYEEYSRLNRTIQTVTMYGIGIFLLFNFFGD